MRGPLPAGSYHIGVSGYQSTRDAQMRADVIFRRNGSADVIVASADSSVPVPTGLPGDIDATVSGAAVPGASGDLLVLRVQMVTGTSDYIELGTHLTIP